MSSLSLGQSTLRPHCSSTAAAKHASSKPSCTTCEATSKMMEFLSLDILAIGSGLGAAEPFKYNCCEV